MRRGWMAAVGMGLLVWPSAGRAQEGDASARADALFDAAKQLRAAGQYASACPTFAESGRLAPGVGVSLYLADCYEHIGKPDSAWREFREAEKLARERNDPRAEVAHTRAQALEPRLSGLTLAVPAAAGQEAPEILVDGVRIPPEEWNAPLAVDPGDHVVTVNVHGAAQRKITAHVDPGERGAIVPIAVAPTPTGAAGPQGAPAAPARSTESAGAAIATTAANAGATTAAPNAASATSDAAPATTGSARSTIGLALIGAGVVGVGLGTAFLVKYESTVSPPPSCTPPPKDTASEIASGVSYGIGGAAIMASLIVLFSNPHPPTTASAVTVTPFASAGGAGASLGGRF